MAKSWVPASTAMACVLRVITSPKTTCSSSVPRQESANWNPSASLTKVGYNLVASSSSIPKRAASFPTTKSSSQWSPNTPISNGSTTISFHSKTCPQSRPLHPPQITPKYSRGNRLLATHLKTSKFLLAPCPKSGAIPSGQWATTRPWRYCPTNHICSTTTSNSSLPK